MIVHFDHVSKDRIHCRVFDAEGPQELGQVLFDRKEPYQGSFVVTLKPKYAWVELATGLFGFKAYSQMRDYLFNVVNVKEIRWDGNGRIRKQKRRKK